jgi:putative DNA primase/helicase
MAGVYNFNAQPPKPGDKDLKSVHSQIVDELGAPFHQTRSSYIINQPFFARFWGNKRLAIYDQTSEAFYHYIPENGLWQGLRENETRRLITEDLFAEASACGLNDIGSKVTTGCQRGIMDLIKSDAKVCHVDFFKRDNTASPVIHAANGMVCISKETIELKDFGPDYKSRNQIPITYAAKAPCTRFLAGFLETVLTKDDIGMLQRYCGLILIGGNRAQKLLFLLGKGGTGKGTIVRLIVLILGRINVEQLRVNKLNERFETSRLIGKLLLNVVEAPENFFTLPGAEMVKALCGHDDMSAEKKGINDPLQFEGRYPAVVTSNESLRVRLAGDEDAWMRRIEIIDFPTARPDGSLVIDNFDQILVAEEGSGILAWMIEGARLHWCELSDHKGFESTAEQKERVHNLIQRSKSVEIFVQTNIQKAPTEDLTVVELYDAYVNFCKRKTWTPVKEQTFEIESRHLINQYWSVCRSHDIDRDGKSKRGYHGIDLEPAAQTP